MLPQRKYQFLFTVLMMEYSVMYARTLTFSLNDLFVPYLFMLLVSIAMQGVSYIEQLILRLRRKSKLT